MLPWSPFVSLVLLPFIPRILTLLGATGQTHQVAKEFLWIALPTNVRDGRRHGPVDSAARGG